MIHNKEVPYRGFLFL